MPASLVGKRILVVEDEYFIAADLRNGLVEQAVTVIGPTGDLATALEMLSGEKPDAAVLDINLNDQLSWPLAIELRRRAIPFLFVTGYDSWYLPEAFRDVPQLAKPFSMAVLIGTLSGLVGVPDA
ncbi:response regulator [Novosphingobium kaempferiae]|uniref:response regulator n=1 Tax=Novosphingobium kaempferiae TaxID=2896849 RepID=UPI001E325794|nr:response regulator [Novosphingobium kaempferiae]